MSNLDTCSRDELILRAKARIELERRQCFYVPRDPEATAKACIHFINTFCYTFDPKREPYHFRFVLFPFQEELVRELVRAIMEGYDLFTDKCREMGATYTTVDVLLYFWLFVPGSNFLLGSRKEDYVDNTKAGSELTNKEESLFGKLEYTIARIFDQVLPLGFDPKRNLSYMTLTNPENGNVISGESANDNFSRGGRQKAILLDEFAFWDSDSAAWGSTADTTNCRIVLTTPGIRPSKAKRLRFGEDGEEIKVLSLPYHLDPRKDEAWLTAQRKRRSTEDFAREIMIDWQGSLTGIVYPEISYAELGNFPYDPRWPLWASWDFGLDGVSIIFIQENLITHDLIVVDYYENSEKTIDFYYPFFGGKIKERNFRFYTPDDLTAIRELRVMKNPIHFGDPDVAKRSLIAVKEEGGASSTRSELKKEGIDVSTNKRANDFVTRREQTKRILQAGMKIHDTQRTKRWIKCMENAKYPVRSEHSQATTEVTLPIHNWTSHGRTCFEFFCVNYALGDVQNSGGVLHSGKKSPVTLVPTFRQTPDGDTVLPDILEKMKKELQKQPR